MTKNILLVGLTAVVVEDAQRQLDTPDVKILAATGIEDVRSTFARAEIQHVIIGAGIDLEARLQIVREIFQLSDSTSVHMKDRASGPQDFLPFARTVLRGLEKHAS